MAFSLAPRTEASERALATTDGLPSRDGALLGQRLARRYGDRVTGSFTIPGREGRHAPIPDDVPAPLKAALEACERYYQAFQFVVWAGKTAREALDGALFETLGEA